MVGDSKVYQTMQLRAAMHSPPLASQSMLDIYQFILESSDNRSTNETSDTFMDTDPTTLADIDSGTTETGYESDDLPDDSGLLASAEERIIDPKSYFQKLVFDNSGLFIHKTGISTGPKQDELLLRLPTSSNFRGQTNYLLSIIKNLGANTLLQFLLYHNRIH